MSWSLDEIQKRLNLSPDDCPWSLEGKWNVYYTKYIQTTQLTGGSIKLLYLL